MRNNPRLDRKMFDAGYVPARSIAKVTGMATATFSKAGKAGKIRTQTVGARVYFAIGDVIALWPVFAKELKAIRPGDEDGDQRSKDSVSGKGSGGGRPRSRSR